MNEVYFYKEFNGKPSNFMEMAVNFGHLQVSNTHPYKWLRRHLNSNYLYLDGSTSTINNTGIYIKAQNLPKGKTLLIVIFPDDKWPGYRRYWDLLFNEMVRQGWIDSKTKNSPGRKELDEDELIYRLSQAIEAERLKKKDNKLTWREIAKTINWRLGCDKSGIKLLEDARKRLERLQYSDPNGLLKKVEERKEKKIS